MRSIIVTFTVCFLLTGGAAAHAQTTPPAAATPDPVANLVARLDLEKYKATIKGLTQFGDRRQGTDRNRAAVDWIEAQLKSYGCTNTERINYDLRAAAGQRRPRRAASGRGAERGVPTPGRAAARPRGYAMSDRRQHRSDEAARREAARARHASRPTPGPREEVYCTKVGTTHPDEMYIVGAHMDGHGWGEAANDDGSGTALVMELARDLQRARRADRALDPLRAVEQRGDRPERRARLRRAAGGAAGQGGRRPDRAGIPSRSGWA